MKNIIEHFQSRGLIHDISNADEIQRLLSGKPVTFYCGFDPTAESLHVGSMVPLIMMRRLQQAGHKPILLFGTATGMIGDPSGRSAERNLLSKEEVEKNVAGIARVIDKFLDRNTTNPYLAVRNHEWIQKLSTMDFLRDVGKHFSVNMMLAKESVKSRLEGREQGISYTEFSYMLLQAYDFFWLNNHHNCSLQIGGSDQWGNITAGIELIRRKSQGEKIAHGFTFPLIKTASGTKFGKTEQGTVWLDRKLTSPYRFYQFWLNTQDSDVISYLKIFTELNEDEISTLKAELENAPELRSGQKRLASEMTTLIHGDTETNRAIEASKVLFGESVKNLDAATLAEIFADVPSTTITKNDALKGIGLQELLVTCKLAKSKGEARRLIEGGGIYLNNERVCDPSNIVSQESFIDGSVLVLRSGKKNYHLVLSQ